MVQNRKTQTEEENFGEVDYTVIKKNMAASETRSRCKTIRYYPDQNRIINTIHASDISVVKSRTRGYLLRFWTGLMLLEPSQTQPATSPTLADSYATLMQSLNLNAKAPCSTPIDIPFATEASAREELAIILEGLQEYYLLH